MTTTTTRWRDLLLGIAALALVLAAAGAVLVYGRPGALHGSTFRLYVPVDAARGVLKGTDVWLEGKKVGAVRGIEFRQPAADTARRVLLTLEVLGKYRPLLRGDSYARIQSGGSLLGAPVVYIHAGTDARRGIEPGDTLRSEPQIDPEDISSRFGQASREFPVIIDNVKLLTAQLRSAQGTLGAMALETEGIELGNFVGQAGALQGAAVGGDGTVGRLLTDGRAFARVRSALARADSLRSLVGSDQAALGRFRRDSTLAREITDARNEISIIRALLALPAGTAGRAMNDRALQLALAEAERELQLLIEDMKKNPLRYLVF